MCVASSLALSSAAIAADWQTLKNCQFVSKDYNDGDSFHVEHRGKEYIFRLYFVDAPETDDRLPERLAEQAAYWKITPAEVLKVGKLAAEFTEQQLKSHPFTAFTKWDNARGDSKLPRYYAFVLVNKKDLGELLVSEGLTRLHGVKTDKPDGTDAKAVEQRLEMLERIAKSKKLGGWAVGSKTKESSARAAPLTTPVLPPLKPNLSQPAATSPAEPAPSASVPPGEAATNSPATAETSAYRISRSGIRHNSRCRYFDSPNNAPCTATEGRACKLCGG